MMFITCFNLHSGSGVEGSQLRVCVCVEARFLPGIRRIHAPRSGASRVQPKAERVRCVNKRSVLPFFLPIFLFVPFVPSLYKWHPRPLPATLGKLSPLSKKNSRRTCGFLLIATHLIYFTHRSVMLIYTKMK